MSLFLLCHLSWPRSSQTDFNFRVSSFADIEWKFHNVDHEKIQDAFDISIDIKHNISTLNFASLFGSVDSKSEMNVRDWADFT